MVVVPVTEVELIGITGSLKNKNSSGYDGISNKILRSCGHVISKSLSLIFNTSLSLAVFPDTLKYAIIKPLFKSGDIYNTANCRPISLLTAFAKLFETAGFRRVSQHFQVYNTLIPEEYGFRRALSTIVATYKLMVSILQAWNNKTHTGGIFCDLSIASDSVNHTIL